MCIYIVRSPVVKLINIGDITTNLKYLSMVFRMTYYQTINNLNVKLYDISVPRAFTGFLRIRVPFPQRDFATTITKWN